MKGVSNHASHNWYDIILSDPHTRASVHVVKRCVLGTSETDAVRTFETSYDRKVLAVRNPRHPSGDWLVDARLSK